VAFRFSQTPRRNSGSPGSKETFREIQGCFPNGRVVQVTIDGISGRRTRAQTLSFAQRIPADSESVLKRNQTRNKPLPGLLITGLQQRCFSSNRSLAKTLKVHRKTVKITRGANGKQYKPEAQAEWTPRNTSPKRKGVTQNQLSLAAESPHLIRVRSLAGASGSYRRTCCHRASDSDERNGRRFTEEEMEKRGSHLQVEAVSAATGRGRSVNMASRGCSPAEQELLEQMTTSAEQVAGQNDARTKKTDRWGTRTHCCPDLGKKDAQMERPPVYCSSAEYDDTKRYLVNRLEAAIAGSDRGRTRYQHFPCPTPPRQRKRSSRRSTPTTQASRLRSLVATDAAREGLNLASSNCSNLFSTSTPGTPVGWSSENADRPQVAAKDRSLLALLSFIPASRRSNLASAGRRPKRSRKKHRSLSQVIDAQAQPSRMERRDSSRRIADLVSRD